MNGSAVGQRLTSCGAGTQRAAAEIAAMLLPSGDYKMTRFTVAVCVFSCSDIFLQLPVKIRNTCFKCHLNGSRGSIIIEALCYKPEGRRFETQRGD
jgi:hypothetical protein